MDEIRREAMNYYQQGTEEQKQLAWEFFKAMDSDGNGSISILELVAFLRQNGLFNDNFYQLFTELDKDNNGMLDFEELITLFFMFIHDKYRDRFAGTTCHVNNDKGIKDESTSDLDESRWAKRQKRLEHFKKFVDATGIVVEAAVKGGCSIM